MSLQKKKNSVSPDRSPAQTTHLPQDRIVREPRSPLLAVARVTPTHSPVSRGSSNIPYGPSGVPSSWSECSWGRSSWRRRAWCRHMSPCSSEQILPLVREFGGGSTARHGRTLVSGEAEIAADSCSRRRHAPETSAKTSLPERRARITWSRKETSMIAGCGKAKRLRAVAVLGHLAQEPSLVVPMSDDRLPFRVLSATLYDLRRGRLSRFCRGRGMPRCSLRNFTVGAMLLAVCFRTGSQRHLPSSGCRHYAPLLQ